MPADPVEGSLGRCIELAGQHVVGGQHNIVADQQHGREVPEPIGAVVERRAQLGRLFIDLIDPLLRLQS